MPIEKCLPGHYEEQQWKLFQRRPRMPTTTTSLFLPFLYMVLPYKQRELRNNVFHLLILIKKSIVSQILI